MISGTDSETRARLSDLALRISGPVMIIGAADSGKSTVASSLVAQMVGAGRRAALVDSDLGQTQVGPPACVGLALFASPQDDLQPVVPMAMVFVGDTSPAGRLLETALAAWKMSTLAAALGAQAVVVNTGGLVGGLYGRRLKLAKADLIRPKVVLALQRQGELEHLLEVLERRGTAALRLPVPPGARRKRPEERRRWRQKRFRAYFAAAGSLELEAGQIPVAGRSLGGGPSLAKAETEELEAELAARVVHGESPGRERHVVLEELPRAKPRSGSLQVTLAASFSRLLGGLIDREGICLALCLIQDWGRERLRLLTPLGADRIREATMVELGELGLGSDFAEFRPPSPWAPLMS